MRIVFTISQSIQSMIECKQVEDLQCIADHCGRRGMEIEGLEHDSQYLNPIEITSLILHKLHKKRIKQLEDDKL